MEKNNKTVSHLNIKSQYRAYTLSYLGFNFVKKVVDNEVIFVFEDTKEFRTACKNLNEFKNKYGRKHKFK